MRALHDLDVLDSAPEEAFDRLTELAADFFDAPIALVSLVDEERQWFKSRVGLDAAQTPREHAFCAWAVNDNDLLEVRDAALDPRFAQNPLVLGEPNIRFYAGAPIRSEHGALGTLCVIDRRPRQLTDRQRRMLEKLADIAAHALQMRRSELESARRARLLELAEQVADVGHWRVDLVEQQLFWSEHVFRIHGQDPATFTPTLEAGVDAYHPDDRERVTRCVQRAIDDRVPFDFQLRLIRADGAIRIVRSIGFPEMNEDGTVVAIFGVFQDITEQREMQERLAQAEKLASVGTLAAGVAHEINNPLSYIWTNAHVLSEEIANLVENDPSKRLRDLAELVHDVMDGTQRINKIVGGLKTFSRPAPNTLRVVDLSQVVEVAEKLCRDEMRKTASFSIQFANGAVPRALADESQLVQVLSNLLANAAHAFDGKSDNHRIVAHLGVDGNTAFVEVEDNGRGMSNEIARQAFTPFYTTKPPGIGTGLGLSICHGIVTAYGGVIEIESAPGVGTKVRVSLPAVESRPGAVVPKSLPHSEKMPRVVVTGGS